MIKTSYCFKIILRRHMNMNESIQTSTLNTPRPQSPWHWRFDRRVRRRVSACAPPSIWGWRIFVHSRDRERAAGHWNREKLCGRPTFPCDGKSYRNANTRKVSIPSESTGDVPCDPFGWSPVRIRDKRVVWPRREKQPCGDLNGTCAWTLGSRIRTRNSCRWPTPAELLLWRPHCPCSCESFSCGYRGFVCWGNASRIWNTVGYYWYRASSNGSSICPFVWMPWHKCDTWTVCCHCESPCDVSNDPFYRTIYRTHCKHTSSSCYQPNWTHCQSLHVRFLASCEFSYDRAVVVELRKNLHNSDIWTTWWANCRDVSINGDRVFHVACILAHTLDRKKVSNQNGLAYVDPDDIFVWKLSRKWCKPMNVVG